MWTKTYSCKVKGYSPSQIWKVWTDINNWNSWQSDVEYSEMQTEFKTGGTFLFKPKGGPKFTLELTEVKDQKLFIDVTKFPLARMYDSHEIKVQGDEIELTCTTSIEGPLAFLWRKIVAENVANGAALQIQALLKQVDKETNLKSI